MRKLIVTEYVTLDGVVEAPGGEPTHPFTGWVFDYHDQELEAYKLREVLEADTLLIGRVTYESFAGAWPDYEGEMADKMNAMPKIVVSATLTDPQWRNTTTLSGDVAAQVAALKEGPGGPILVTGSAALVHTLLDAELVDELRMTVFPVTIGAGLRLFPDTLRKAVWQPLESWSLRSGVRVDSYLRSTPDDPAAG